MRVEAFERLLRWLEQEGDPAESVEAALGLALAHSEGGNHSAAEGAYRARWEGPSEPPEPARLPACSGTSASS
jgi:hypothetical protein